MKREELSDEKRQQYDALVERIMEEIEDQNPDQHHLSGCLDGAGTKIYVNVTKKYIDQLNEILQG